MFPIVVFIDLICAFISFLCLLCASCLHGYKPPCLCVSDFFRAIRHLVTCGTHRNVTIRGMDPTFASGIRWEAAYATH